MYSGLRTRRFSLRFITRQSQPRASNSLRRPTKLMDQLQTGGAQLPISRMRFTSTWFPVFLMVDINYLSRFVARFTELGRSWFLGGFPPVDQGKQVTSIRGSLVTATCTCLVPSVLACHNLPSRLAYRPVSGLVNLDQVYVRAICDRTAS